jgi:hypothetical protein
METIYSSENSVVFLLFFTTWFRLVSVKIYLSYFIHNIKMDLGEIGWDGRDWIELAQDRDQWRALANTVMNLWVP